MAQEFTIKSEAIESKINQLLPTQGGFQPGVDFSASTMVIPIVDLTETAEGSSLRQDLQTAFSHTVTTPFNVANATTTVINTTGYFRVFGVVNSYQSTVNNGEIRINDGFSSKAVFRCRNNSSGNAYDIPYQYDFIVKLEAGDSLVIVSNNNQIIFTGSTRQIADLSGNLTNP